MIQQKHSHKSSVHGKIFCGVNSETTNISKRMQPEFLDFERDRDNDVRWSNKDVTDPGQTYDHEQEKDAKS